MLMIGVNKAVYSERLSKRLDSRYIIVDEDTGEILDDAQGYGYKSKPNAYRGYAYKQKQRQTRKGKSGEQK